MKSLLDGCKLTYCTIPGRGEATRLALTIGGFHWEDHRVAFDEWPTLKAHTPWGSLPLLTLKDGTEVAQQRAILRLVGKEAGLYPTARDHVVQAALIDSLMDACEDIWQKCNAVGQGLPPDEKKLARAEAVAPCGVVYQLLQKVEAFCQQHGKDGYAVGIDMSVADLYVYGACGGLVSGLYGGVPTDAIDKPEFKHIMAIRKSVRKHPAVQKYYQNLDAKWHDLMPPAYGPFE